MENRQKLPKRLGQRKRDSCLLILRSLIKKPSYPRELVKELRVSRNTVNYHLGRFVKYGIVRKLSDKRYAFINYVDGEEAVVSAVKRWKEVAFRYPTTAEIANELGIKLEDAELLVLKTEHKTRWWAPNEAIIESATEKLGEVLVCAARMRDGHVKDGKSEYFDYENDREILEEGERFRQEHPEVLPKLTEDGDDVVSWPSEALKYLGKIYTLKDRRIPCFGVAYPPRY